MKKYFQYGLLATVIGASSCVHYITDGKERGIPNPISVNRPKDQTVFYAWQVNFSENLKRILNGEFDKVNITSLETKVIINDKIDYKIETVVRGYEKDGYNYHAIFGLNIDRICDEYVKGRTLINYFVGDDLYAFPNDGTVVHSKLSKKAAEALDKLLNAYIKANNNDICKEWREWNQKNFGPLN